MSKPKFDPNKPFRVVDDVNTQQSAPKPKFDPNKPFIELEEPSAIQSMGETAQDAAVAAAQGATMGYSDEMIGVVVAAYKKATGDETPYEQLYEEVRDGTRELQKTGQARSPVVSFFADLVGGVVNPVGRAIKGAGVASRYLRGLGTPKTVGQAAVSGAVQGVGYGDTPEEMAQQGALGAGAGFATQGLGSFITSKFDKPDKIRASALGASKKDFKVKGPQNREQVVKLLKDKGFYTLAPRAWDPKNRKFSSSLASPDLAGLDLPDRYMERALDAIEKLSKENQSLLSGIKVDTQDLNSAINKTINKSKRGTLPQTAQEDAVDFLNKWTAENLPVGPIKASDLEQLKRNIQEELSSTYRNLGSNDVKLAQRKELLMDLQSNLKELLENKAGSKLYAENNKLMSALFTQKSDLEDLIAKEAAQSGRGFRGFYETVTGIVDDATGGQSREMARASAGDLLNKYANIARLLGGSAQQAPQKGVFQSLEPQQNVGRSPDSLQNYNFSRVKSLMSQQLPRDTEQLTHDGNKQLLLMKVYHQISPEAASYLEKQFEIYGNEQMKPILKKFVTDNPALFAPDEYNRVDGVITDDLMIQKAVSDVSKAPMGAIEKARTIDAIMNRKRNVSWPKSQE
jgi:hypothetical protein